MGNEGVRIRISSEDDSFSCTHSLLIIDVNPLVDSRRESVFRGSLGVIGTGGLFTVSYFEVFPKSSRNTSSIYGRSPRRGSSLGSGLSIFEGSAWGNETSLDTGSVGGHYRLIYTTNLHPNHRN